MNLLRSCVSGIQDKFADPSVVEDRRINEVCLDAIPIYLFRQTARQIIKKDEIVYELKAITRKQRNHPIAKSAKLSVNKKKNTNDKVLPFEYNRVELKPIEDDPGSDYVNASWVNGFRKPGKYIACQGPNVRTISDFWRMVWEHKCACIVMATNLFEHSKQQCEKYWPNTKETYDEVTVETRTVFSVSEYTIRNFRIGARGYTRDIRQIQFESWSDNDNPKIATVLEVRRQMCKWMEGRMGPIVVHCNNGGGRTGAFICIDDMMCKIDSGDDLDVALFTLELRNTRQHMIFSLDQYRYVYEVVASYILVSITVVTREAGKLAVTSKSMAVTVGGKTVNPETELRLINCLVKKLSVGDCAGGHRAENRAKSRQIMIQPPERARPYLTTAEGSENTDYINAVYVDGYRMWNQYIVTQWPKKNTINDFWRLANDHNLAIIVLLENAGNKSKSCPVFWPATTGEPKSYGPIQVEVLEEADATRNVHCKLLKVNKTLAGKNPVPPKNVVLLQLLCWPPRLQLPESTLGFLEIVELTDEWKIRLEPCGPICVVSRDGISRCGSFCSIHACLERLLAEGEYDVFRTVETVKKNRPQLINTTMEYNYCYTCMNTIASRLPDTLPKLAPPSSPSSIAAEEIYERNSNSDIEFAKPMAPEELSSPENRSMEDMNDPKALERMSEIPSTERRASRVKDWANDVNPDQKPDETTRTESQNQMTNHNQYYNSDPRLTDNSTSDRRKAYRRTGSGKTASMDHYDTNIGHSTGEMPVSDSALNVVGHAGSAEPLMNHQNNSNHHPPSNYLSNHVNGAVSNYSINAGPENGYDGGNFQHNSNHVDPYKNYPGTNIVVDNMHHFHNDSRPYLSKQNSNSLYNSSADYPSSNGGSGGQRPRKRLPSVPPNVHSNRYHPPGTVPHSTTVYSVPSRPLMSTHYATQSFSTNHTPSSNHVSRQHSMADYDKSRGDYGAPPLAGGYLDRHIANPLLPNRSRYSRSRSPGKSRPHHDQMYRYPSEERFEKINTSSSKLTYRDFTDSYI